MRRLTPIVSVFTLIVVVLVGAGRDGAATFAQDATPVTAGHPLVGTWSLEDPDFPPSLAVFHPDGTLLEVDADGQAGVGVWEATGERTVNVTIEFLAADGAGAVITFKVRGSGEVAADGQRFNATYTAEAILPDGSSTGEYGPGTVTGTRLAVEPMATPVGPLADLMAQFEATPAAKAAVAEKGYQELTITGTEYAFEGVPETIEAGYTLITLQNAGQEFHHAQLAKLNEGVTLEQAEAALPRAEEDPEAIFALVTPVGGLGIVAPGGKAQIILNLDPGTYAFVCLIPAPDGEPHFAKGMIQAFEVVPAAEESAAEPPEADATLTLKDFTFEGLPRTVEPGSHIWKLVNEGPEQHELLLFQLAPGATAEEFLTALEASLESPAEAEPPPGLPIGGMQAMAPGLTGWLVLDLEPGTYLAVCFIPSPANEGKEHVELGMLAEFTVEAPS